MKQLFNFYLEDAVKKSATEKINKLTCDTSKGQLSSLIRTLLQMFIENENQDQLNEIALKVMDNYVECTFKNKRSKL